MASRSVTGKDVCQRFYWQDCSTPAKLTKKTHQRQKQNIKEIFNLNKRVTFIMVVSLLTILKTRLGHFDKGSLRLRVAHLAVRLEKKVHPAPSQISRNLFSLFYSPPSFLFKSCRTQILSPANLDDSNPQDLSLEDLSQVNTCLLQFVA